MNSTITQSGAGHTSGPWFTRREGFSTVYIEARIAGGMIQEVAACGPTAEGQEQQSANAELIATAPALLIERDRLKAVNAELLAALERIVEWNSRTLDSGFRAPSSITQIQLTQASAAIASATKGGAA